MRLTNLDIFQRNPLVRANTKLVLFGSLNHKTTPSTQPDCRRVTVYVAVGNAVDLAQRRSQPIWLRQPPSHRVKRIIAHQATLGKH